MLRSDLEQMYRPFGEFVPGGNAAAPGQLDEQIAMVKKVRIDRKNVSVVEGQADEESTAGARRKAGPIRMK